MDKVLSSKYFNWENDVYRLDEIEGDGIEVFMLRDKSWVKVSGKLVATIEFEGRRIEPPIF